MRSSRLPPREMDLVEEACPQARVRRGAEGVAVGEQGLPWASKAQGGDLFPPETTVWEAVDEALDTLPTHEPDES